MRIRMRKAVEFAVENSLLMVPGAVIALIRANTSPEGYEAAVHPLHSVVNDIGVVLFFGFRSHCSSLRPRVHRARCCSRQCWGPCSVCRQPL